MSFDNKLKIEIFHYQISTPKSQLQKKKKKKIVNLSKYINKKYIKVITNNYTWHELQIIDIISNYW